MSVNSECNMHGVTEFQCTLLSLCLYKDQQTFHTPEKKSSSETPQMSSPRIQDFYISHGLNVPG